MRKGSFGWWALLGLVCGATFFTGMASLALVSGCRVTDQGWLLPVNLASFVLGLIALYNLIAEEP